MIVMRTDTDHIEGPSGTYERAKFKRELEKNLIKEGMPRKAAKALVSGGFRSYLKAEGREDEIPQWEMELGLKSNSGTTRGNPIPSSDRDPVVDLLIRAELAAGA